MRYWSAVDILKQLSMELAIKVQNTVVNVDNPQGMQLLAALNSAGNELVLYYPWEQFAKQWEFPLVADQDEYPLPSDWRYFRDQSQWDRTNHWPLLGPKSAAEWAFLKGGIVASFPRMRYRVKNDKLCFFPKPGTDNAYQMAMEYIGSNWVQNTDSADQTPNADMITKDGDIPWFDPWILIKFTKLKFYQLKGFDTSGVQGDFMRVFEALKGKDTGAPVLSMNVQKSPYFIGIQSIPDGNWTV